VVWPWQRRRGDRSGSGRAGLTPGPGEAAGRAGAHPLDDPAFVSGLRPVPVRGATGPAGWPAATIVGQAPDGAPVRIGFDGDDLRPVLLAFLSVDCLGCEPFWEGLADAPGGPGLVEPSLASVRPVVVTRGPGTVSPDKVAALAAPLGTVPVVMSDAAWSDYRVTGYPFFIAVDPSAQVVRAETVGMDWADVRSILAEGDR